MFKKFLLAPIFAVLIAAVFPLHTYAAQFYSGDYTLDTESVVEDDLYIIGDNVIVKGVVDGDLVIFGQNITVDGTVTGDLYIFGTSISTAGSIYGNLFSFGSNVSVKGTLGQSVYIASMMADLDADIGKDLNIAAGTVKIAGGVGDDVRVATGQMSSEASVSGDFLLSSDSYTVNEEMISGEFVLATESKEDKPVFEFSKENFLGFNLGLAMVSFVGMYIVGILLIYTAPVKTLSIGKKVTGSWEDLFKSFAIGLLILFAVPLPLFLLVITLVGAPLALLITAILIFLVTFGTLWTETAIGHKVLSLANYKDNYRFFSLLVGRLITVIIKLIPFVNIFYSLALSAITVGAVARTKYSAFTRPEDSKVSKVTKK